MNPDLIKLFKDLIVLDYIILNANSCGVPLDFESKIENKAEVIREQLRTNNEFQLLVHNKLKEFKEEYEA